MKTRVINKIMRYIREKNLKKVKSYLKEHEVDMVSTMSKLLFGDSLLHLSCRYGRDDVMRYLLKKGADPLLCNEDGNLPLHLACFYLQTHPTESFVYEDLVEPLVRRTEPCLDQPNSNHVTCQQLLTNISAARDSKMGATCSDEEVTSGEEWNQRLAREMMDEYAEQAGPFCEDYFTEDQSETWDDWASRMAEEYRAKHQGPLSSPQVTWYSRKRTSGHSDDSHGDKRPKIDSKKREKLDQSIREEHRKTARLRSDQKIQRTVDLRTQYEKTCTKVFNSGSNMKLNYKDIPWPHQPESDIDSTEYFLFCDLEKGSENYKKYLKAQQIRWHPDRFQQKCGKRLAGQDRDVILEKVKRLSQLLNKLAE